MKLTLKVNRHTTTSELIHLGMLFTALGLNAGAKVFAPPTDPAELDEPEGAVTYVPTPPLTADAAIVNAEAAGNEPPKRRRRTKAEIEAEAAEAEATRIAEAEAEAQRSNEAGLKAIEDAAGVHAGSAIPSHEGEAGNDQPAATQPATATAGAEKEVAASEPATASPSDAGKTYTPAEVQGLAVDTARRYGPEKVKALIATYPGAAKIADLPESELPGFVAKLQAITA